jgi:lipid-binding SYLF domain-containing protein
MSRNRRSLSVLLVVLAAVALAAAAPAAAQQAETRIVEDAIAVFSALDDLPDREVPSFMVKDAWGVAVFPNLRKYGLLVGLQRGQGVILARAKAGGWGPPLFVSLSGGTVGWQVGVQSVDLVLFFLTPESVVQALEGRLTLGVDVAVAAGGFGRQAGAGTDADLRAEIVSYARTRGFFAGATIGSASIDADDEANAAFYGVPDLRAADILAGKVRALPPSAAALRKLIGARALR